ncbi:thioredoxin [Paenibacillus bouchesdurhonensis]|uniref:thioredoxin n=1 Tax=Paenibacillus bouchesdurhonensis TaxID=1870990 RepID=UPI000DA63973|nr:thioredoxin [Paenibacillus bouchesdurhonensis]
MSAIALTKDSFQNQVQSGVTLIDFWAPWCGPCRVQLPIVEELANEVNGRAVIAKVNVDEEVELAGQLGITGIPTLILFKDGHIVEKLVGLRSKQDLKTKIEQLLA